MKCNGYGWPPVGLKHHILYGANATKMVALYRVTKNTQVYLFHTTLLGVYAPKNKPTTTRVSD